MDYCFLKLFVYEYLFQCHGLVMRLSDSRDKSDLCQSAPLALFPSKFPAKLFQQAQEVQNVSFHYDI